MRLFSKLKMGDATISKLQEKYLGSMDVTKWETRIRIIDNLISFLYGLMECDFIPDDANVLFYTDSDDEEFINSVILMFIGRKVTLVARAHAIELYQKMSSSDIMFKDDLTILPVLSVRGAASVVDKSSKYTYILYDAHGPGKTTSDDIILLMKMLAPGGRMIVQYNDIHTNNNADANEWYLTFEKKYSRLYKDPMMIEAHDYITYEPGKKYKKHFVIRRA